MVVEFVTTRSKKDDVIVIAEGSGVEVAEFIEWLDTVEIDSVTYAEFFTGIPFREVSGLQTFWCTINDPDHDKRILIKLRWK